VEDAETREPIYKKKKEPGLIEIEEDEPSEESKAGDIVAAETSGLATCLGVICFPFTLCCSWFIVNEQEEVVKLNYGKFTGVESGPGCHWANCFGRELRTVDKRIISLDLPNQKIVEKSGNPLVVSAIVVYHVEDAKKATLDVTDVNSYIMNEATAVLKKVVSLYPYECHHEDGREDDMSLKNEAAAIQQQMVKLLQKHVRTAGAKIHLFQFNELSYAPEIAAGMLRRQQARAMVAARKKIVQGAVEIAYGACEKLNERGVKMTTEEKKCLTSNLLAVICADSDSNQQSGLAAASLEQGHNHHNQGRFGMFG
jgi:regulator of protease activity HflC (stomatin/prohibitin superfamily)